METDGRKRTNRNSKLRNRPNEPTSVAQSQSVAEKTPHELGRKSLCRLSITITYRSNHIPVQMTSDRTKRIGRFVLTRLNQSNCGAIAFETICVQNIKA